MTKEGIIKEAYGELFNTHSHLIDSEGWLNNSNENDYLTMGETDFLGETDFKNNTWFRPKSLSGIEYNNGWTTLNSIDDFPKTDKTIQLWFMTKSGHITQNNWNNKFTHKVFGYLKVYSHFQVVIEPNPPIY